MTNPFDHIEQLCAWLRGTDIGLLELTGPTGSLRLLNDGASVRVERADAAGLMPSHAVVMTLRATSPGVFLVSHPLHDRPIAAIGADIQTGEPVGFLQIGPLLTPVLALQAGTVTDVLAVHGAIVGYGTPLVELQSMEGEATR